MAQSLAILVAILIVLSALELSSRLFLEGASFEGTRKEVIVTIPQGATVDEIANILFSNDLIEHPKLFGLAARFLDADTKLHSGTMKLALGQSMVDVIRTLTTAKAVGVAVTIREGLTTMQIAGLLAHELKLDSTGFMETTRNTALLSKLRVQAPSFEGYLFPDTYFFRGSEGPDEVIERMVENFRIQLPPDIQLRLSGLGMSLNEVLTLASIVEWECMVRSEARTISSVYHNRLRKGMPLQADPTVAYALGKGPSRLFFRDLKVDSPYNTYMYHGLPPGPINNPGRQSLEAALSPAQTPYLFFVAQGDGTHAFTTTLNDHLSAKQKLDELRRTAGSDEAGAEG
jgi:UPF0755 protein